MVYSMMLTIKFFHDQRGNTALEYGVIAGTTAVVIMAAVTILGTNLGTVLCQTVGGLGGICPAQQLAQLADNNCNIPGSFTMSADGQSCDVTWAFSSSTGWGAMTESRCATGGGTWVSTSNSCKTTSITVQQCVFRGSTFDANTGSCLSREDTDWSSVRTDPNTGESYTRNGCPSTLYTYDPPSYTQVFTDTNGNLHTSVPGVILPVDYPKSTSTKIGDGTTTACSWR